jgi:hypothetical protein
MCVHEFQKSYTNLKEKEKKSKHSQNVLTFMFLGRIANARGTGQSRFFFFVVSSLFLWIHIQRIQHLLPIAKANSFFALHDDFFALNNHNTSFFWRDKNVSFHQR